MIREDIVGELQTKLKALNQTLWEDKARWNHVERWLVQFEEDSDLAKDERIQMLFLASHFMYFGIREIRALLRALFRDQFQYRVIQEIRKVNSGTRDSAVLTDRFNDELAKTRFVGIGNPSESGSHLLYYFRQENRLPKTNFVNSNEVFTRRGFWKFSRRRIRDESIDRYIFIDDLCGSGTQAEEYSRDVVEPLKKLRPATKVSYFTLFATTSGLKEVRKLPWFDEVETVVELDDSFKCFSDTSRIYRNEEPPYDRALTEKICATHGKRLAPGFPLGWRDGQLLIGFCHNTPDNTLPVIWYDEADGPPWVPLFRRYPKQYG